MVHNFQHRFKTNFWADLLDDVLVRHSERYLIFVFYIYYTFKHLSKETIKILISLSSFIPQIGPFELPARVNSEIYLNFLQNNLPVLLENVPLNQRRLMIFQHDSAPTHSSRNVRRFLDATYPNRWIGRGGPRH